MTIEQKKFDFVLNPYQKKAWSSFNKVFKEGFAEFNKKYNFFDETSGLPISISGEPKWRDEDYLYSSDITKISASDPDAITRLRMIVMATNYSVAYCYGYDTDKNGKTYSRLNMSEEYVEYYDIIRDIIFSYIDPTKSTKFEIEKGKTLAECLLSYSRKLYVSKCKDKSRKEKTKIEHEMSLDDEKNEFGFDIPAPEYIDEDSGNLSALGKFYSFIKAQKEISSTNRERLMAMLLEILICQPCYTVGCKRKGGKTTADKEMTRKMDVNKFIAYANYCFSIDSKTGKCRNDFIDERLRKFCLDFPRATGAIPRMDDFRSAVSCFEIGDEIKTEPMLPKLLELDSIESFMTKSLYIKKRIITPREYFLHIREMLSDANRMRVDELIKKYADNNDGLISSDTWKMTLVRARKKFNVLENDIRGLFF